MALQADTHFERDTIHPWRLVFEAYGLPADLTDDEILRRLLDLNLQRGAA